MKGPEKPRSGRNSLGLPAASSEMEMVAADDVWCRETAPRVMELVCPRLPQRDACALLAVNPWCYRALVANPKLWEVRSPNQLRLLLRILF
jgi:hypothetical protein